jgi:hypothetical protein
MMCLHHQIGRGFTSFLVDGAGRLVGTQLAPSWEDANTHSFHCNLGNWIFLYRIHGDEGGCGRNADSCACTVSGACTSRLSSPYATDAESDPSRPRWRGQCPWRDRKRTWWSAWWRNGRHEQQRHSLAPRAALCVPINASKQGLCLLTAGCFSGSIPQIKRSRCSTSSLCAR